MAEGISFAASLEDVYGGDDLHDERIEALLDASLHPRGPDTLFDLAAGLGIGPGHHALDVGSADARRTVQLARRLGCHVTGVEPVMANLQRGRARIAEAAGEAGRLEQVRSVAQALPFRDGSFDLVWCRDMLVHVEPLAEALAECRRVAKPGAPMVIFNMFATPWLEPSDAARLWPPLAGVPANTDPAHFERCVADAGWTVERVDELMSEWREYLEESGAGKTSKQLLHVARLLRDPDHYVQALGRASYEAELADSLWGVFQMIGKLSPRVYLLRRD
jgi:ubiquinone/menaquinone biosynthesis C-methylase UbiE